LPVIAFVGDSSVCEEGKITSLSATPAGGKWKSLNLGTAIIDETSGEVTGVLAGTVKVRYTVTNGDGCTDSADVTITVKALPVVTITGVNAICEEGKITLSGFDGGQSHTGGTWKSLDPTIATVDASGEVTGVLAGMATIRYTITNGVGCTDSADVSITVKALPVVTIEGKDTICVAGTLALTGKINGGTLSTGFTGTWKSVNPSIMTVDASGVVTGVSAGKDSIRYIVTNLDGCTDSVSVEIVIKPLPVVSITGLNSICIGNTTYLSPIKGGTWVSNNTSVATVDAKTGVVTGLATGSATFTFTDSITGCSNTTNPVQVGTFPPVDDITAVAKSAFCVDSTIQLTCATTGGTWKLSNTNATIVGTNTDNPVSIKGVMQGKTYVSYTVGTGVCQSTSTFLIKIVPATPPEIIIGFER
jgi:uncharacterized protein YjdB